MKKFEEKDLVSKYEPILFKISLVFSILLWLLFIVGTIGIGLIYVGIGALIGLIIHISFISYVKGNGVKVTEEQFPELDRIKKEIAKEMGFTKYTYMYVVNFDGMLNAFATKLLSRNFIIITASILEACDNDIDKLKFIIAHELAHIKRKHVHRQALLLPSKLIPWLGNAYSKACEYTCDNYGVYYGTKDTKKAVKGLAVLATGGVYSEKINIDAYLKQALESNSFWMSLNETKLSHPYLTKRVFNIVKTFEDNSLKLPKRNIFGIILAPFTNMYFWIVLFYISIIIFVASETLKEIKQKSGLGGINSTVNLNNTKIISENYPTIDNEKLDVFIKIFETNKDKYNFFLYSKKYDKEDYVDLYVKDYKNGKFYLTLASGEEVILDKNDSSIWGFYIGDKNDEHLYYDEQNNLTTLKELIK